MINLISESGKIILTSDHIENNEISIHKAVETKKTVIIKEDNKFSITIKQLNTTLIIAKTKTTEEMSSDKTTTSKISKQAINKWGKCIETMNNQNKDSFNNLKIPLETVIEGGVEEEANKEGEGIEGVEEGEVDREPHNHS